MRRAFWTFTGPRSIASVAQLALQRVDVLLVASLAGLGAAATYAVAGRFVVLGQFANQGISQAVQPRLAEALAVRDRAEANRLYRTATGWLVLLTWPLYLLVMAYAPLYLGHLRHRPIATAPPIVVVLAAAMMLATGCGMVDIVLSMAGKTSWNLAQRRCRARAHDRARPRADPAPRRARAPRSAWPPRSPPTTCCRWPRWVSSSGCTRSGAGTFAAGALALALLRRRCRGC